MYYVSFRKVRALHPRRVGLGRALTAQGSRSLPSTPRAVPGQSLGARTLRCGLYGVLLYFVSFFGPGS